MALLCTEAFTLAGAVELERMKSGVHYEFIIFIDLADMSQH